MPTTAGQAWGTSSLPILYPNSRPSLVGRPSWSHVLVPRPITRWQLLCLFLRDFAYSQARINFESKTAFRKI